MPVMTQLGPAVPAGLTRYQSAVFGSDYQDNFFAAMFNLRKVTRHVLEPDGATFRTRDSDFLVSTNRDFHPTDVIEDADGSLIVVDTGPWYKLCCPTSQLAKPDVLGAIYRVKRSARRAHRRSARHQHPVGGIFPAATRGAARRRAAGSARAGDGAAGENRCGRSGFCRRRAPALGAGLDPSRSRVDADAHRRPGSASSGSRGTGRPRCHRPTGRRARGGPASRRGSRASTDGAAPTRQSRTAARSRRSARPDWRSVVGACAPRLDGCGSGSGPHALTRLCAHRNGRRCRHAGGTHRLVSGDAAGGADRARPDEQRGLAAGSHHAPARVARAAPVGYRMVDRGAAPAVGIGGRRALEDRADCGVGRRTPAGAPARPADEIRRARRRRRADCSDGNGIGGLGALDCVADNGGHDDEAAARAVGGRAPAASPRSRCRGDAPGAGGGSISGRCARLGWCVPGNAADAGS